MPIEIREVTIKVSVDQPQQENEVPDRNNALSKFPEKEDLIAEIVEQIVDMLNLQKER
ncbi:MAG: hypothetical protein JXA03_15960 [Bacteroidales bacterium]|nr:hypothetical protein [Bacteroidales bacterium]